VPIRLIQPDAPLPKHHHADAQARQAQRWHNRSSGLSEAYQPIYPIKRVISKSGNPFETDVFANDYHNQDQFGPDYF